MEPIVRRDVVNCLYSEKVELFLQIGQFTCCFGCSETNLAMDLSRLSANNCIFSYLAEDRLSRHLIESISPGCSEAAHIEKASGDAVRMGIPANGNIDIDFDW